jgi:hypothetical protein
MQSSYSFFYTSTVSAFQLPHINHFLLPGAGISKPKSKHSLRIQRSRSHMILMLLILSMFIAQTVHNFSITYQVWLAFIRYGDSIDGTLSVINFIQPKRTVYALAALDDFLSAFRLGVADSIMIWRCWIICGRSWSVVVVPMALNIGSIGMYIQVFSVFSRCPIPIQLQTDILYFISYRVDYIRHRFQSSTISSYSR